MSTPQETQPPAKARSWPWIAIAALMVLGLSMAGSMVNLPFTLHSNGHEFQPVNLMGAFGTVAILLLAYRELRVNARADLARKLSIVVFAAVALFWLCMFVAYTKRCGDWYTYEAAAKATIAHKSPYVGTSYNTTYTPLPAHLLADIYRVTEWASSLARKHPGSVQSFTSPTDQGGVVANSTGSSTFLWGGAFFICQYDQFLLFMLTFYLCFLIMRRLGVNEAYASLMAGALMVVNNALIWDFMCIQLSLWPLLTVLIAFLALDRRPWISGFLIAFGGLIKIYPLFVLLPWLLAKKLKVVAWTLIGLVVIVAADVFTSKDPGSWLAYLHSFGKIGYGECPADNSIHSFVYEIVRFCMGAHPEPLRVLPSMIVEVIWRAIALGVVVLFVRRFILRERSYRALLGAAKSDDEIDWAQRARMFSHTADAFALMLLISPLVWSHHYVLAMPVIIWAVFAQAHRRPWLVIGGSLLAIAVPQLQFLLLGSHSLIGLVMLVVATKPVVPARPETLVDTKFVSPFGGALPEGESAAALK